MGQEAVSEAWCVSPVRGTKLHSGEFVGSRRSETLQGPQDAGWHLITKGSAAGWD